MGRETGLEGGIHMFVFEFRCHFVTGPTDDIQSRYVVAHDEDEAWEKIDEHFIVQSEQGFDRPCFIANPTVLVQNVLI